MSGKIMEAKQRQGKLRFGELILKWTARGCNGSSQNAQQAQLNSKQGYLLRQLLVKLAICFLYSPLALFVY